MATVNLSSPRLGDLFGLWGDFSGTCVFSRLALMAVNSFIHLQNGRDLGERRSFSTSLSFSKFTKILASLSLLPWVVRHSFFLFIRWRKEKEKGQEENEGQTLALQESGRCVTLVALKDLSWRISRRDRVQPSRVTSRILASTWSSDLVSSLLDLRQASLRLGASF